MTKTTNNIEFIVNGKYDAKKGKMRRISICRTIKKS